MLGNRGRFGYWTANRWTDTPVVWRRLAGVLRQIRQVLIRSDGNRARESEIRRRISQVLRHIRQVLRRLAENRVRTRQIRARTPEVRRRIWPD